MFHFIPTFITTMIYYYHGISSFSVNLSSSPSISSEANFVISCWNYGNKFSSNMYNFRTPSQLDRHNPGQKNVLLSLNLPLNTQTIIHNTHICTLQSLSSEPIHDKFFAIFLCESFFLVIWALFAELLFPFSIISTLYLIPERLLIRLSQITFPLFMSPSKYLFFIRLH